MNGNIFSCPAVLIVSQAKTNQFDKVLFPKCLILNNSRLDSKPGTLQLSVIINIPPNAYKIIYLKKGFFIESILFGFLIRFQKLSLLTKKYHQLMGLLCYLQKQSTNLPIRQILLIVIVSSC